MLKTVILSLSLVFYSQVAFTAEPVNLESTMKTMGFAFKQATEATSPADALPYLEKLQHLTEQAKHAPLPSDKATVYTEGLDKVLAELLLAKEAAENDDMPKLQQHLKQVDELKNQYHKERRFSLWHLIFGKY